MTLTAPSPDDDELADRIEKYSKDQPRDQRGRWSRSGASGSAPDVALIMEGGQGQLSPRRAADAELIAARHEMKRRQAAAAGPGISSTAESRDRLNADVHEAFPKMGVRVQVAPGLGAYQGVSATVIHEAIGKSLKRLAKEYPGVGDHLTGFSTHPLNGSPAPLARVQPGYDGYVLEVDTDRMLKNFVGFLAAVDAGAYDEKELANRRQNSSYLNQTSVEEMVDSVITHEFGHMLQIEGEMALRKIARGSAHLPNNSQVLNAPSPSEIVLQWETTPYVSSSYGAKSPGEFFAEGFTFWKKGMPDRAPEGISRWVRIFQDALAGNIDKESAERMLNPKYDPPLRKAAFSHEYVPPDMPDDFEDTLANETFEGAAVWEIGIMAAEGETGEWHRGPESVAKYREGQARNPAGSPTGGQFASGGAGGGGSYDSHPDRISTQYSETYQPKKGPHASGDPTRTSTLDKADHERLADHLAENFKGVTEKQMVKNLLKVYERTGADFRKAGKIWYDQAHADAQAISKRDKRSLRHSVAIIAALSPQHEWGSNRKAADYLSKAEAEDWTVPNLDHDFTKGSGKLKETRTLDQWVDKELGYHVGAEGKKLSELTPKESASVIKAMSQLGWDHDGSGNFTASGNMGISWSCGTDAITKGVRLARGEEPNAVLAGHKVRSFYNNILDPEGSLDVTVDTHAIGAAVGFILKASSPELKKGFNQPAMVKYSLQGTYPLIADAYREAAEQIGGLTPKQFQAIVWLQWQDEAKAQVAEDKRVRNAAKKKETS